MFNFTKEERGAILFLSAAALIGLGINFFGKINPQIKRLAKAEEYILKINLNKAGLEDLLGTRLLSPRLAKKIIAYRDAKGGFRGVGDLKEIKGIGDYRYEKLRNLFCVE